MASQAACLAPLRASLFAPHGALVQPHAGDAVAFDAALDPHEDLGVDGLRAGVAAPQAPGHGGEEEQRQRRQHQQRRQEDQVLRIQHQAQDVEALRLQVEQHRLAAAPLQPGQAVEEQLRQPDQGPAPRGEPALHRARVDVGLPSGTSTRSCVSSSARSRRRPRRIGMTGAVACHRPNPRRFASRACAASCVIASTRRAWLRSGSTRRRPAAPAWCG